MNWRVFGGDAVGLIGLELAATLARLVASRGWLAFDGPGTRSVRKVKYKSDSGDRRLVKANDQLVRRRHQFDADTYFFV